MALILHGFRIFLSFAKETNRGMIEKTGRDVNADTRSHH